MSNNLDLTSLKSSLDESGAENIILVPTRNKYFSLDRETGNIEFGLHTNGLENQKLASLYTQFEGFNCFIYSPVIINPNGSRNSGNYITENRVLLELPKFVEPKKSIHGFRPEMEIEVEGLAQKIQEETPDNMVVSQQLVENYIKNNIYRNIPNPTLVLTRIELLDNQRNELSDLCDEISFRDLVKVDFNRRQNYFVK